MWRAPSGAMLLQESEFCQINHEQHWDEYINAPVGTVEESFQLFQWRKFEEYLDRNSADFRAAFNA